MKNTLEGINSRITDAEEWISDLENRMMGITATEQNIEKIMKKKKEEEEEEEDSLRDLWDNINDTNFSLYGSQKRREKELKKIFEEMSENFPTMGKEIVNQVQEAQRVPSRINPKRNTPRHTVIKLTKIKDSDKILKATREK